MAYIKIEHSKLNAAASEVEDYVALMKDRMSNAKGEVDTLSSNWQGADFMQFKTRWNKVTGNDSTYFRMLQSLESYAQYLRYAETQYKNAQIKAINRANSLPRY